jgi:hypothetical protein
MRAMKPVDKFGNPICSCTCEVLLNIGKSLEEFESKIEKPDAKATTEQQHRDEYEMGFYVLLRFLLMRGVIEPPKSDSLEDYAEYWAKTSEISKGEQEEEK